jgi:hypothetical protein
MTTLPAWSQRYLDGQNVGRAEAMMAYAQYYCVDGSADTDPEIEERIEMHRPPLVGYASRTGTKRNLAALRAAGWRLLVSATACLRTEGMRYAMDNGAWTAFQQNKPFDEDAFMRAIDKLGESADWIVVPDIVTSGLRSLDYSLSWLEKLRGLPTPLLLAVQDGMEPNDVRELLSPAVGIFIGGSTEWKEETANQWGRLARRRNCYLHVGRVNSQRRIGICNAAGANSFDGTSASRFSKSLQRLAPAVLQDDLFAASRSWQEV